MAHIFIGNVILNKILFSSLACMLHRLAFRRFVGLSMSNKCFDGALFNVKTKLTFMQLHKGLI